MLKKERRLAQERGAFLKVVKFSEDEACAWLCAIVYVLKCLILQVAAQAAKTKTASLEPEYTPLAKDESKPESRGESMHCHLPRSTHCDSSPYAATIGTARYIYYGRHSEGNRFIRNDDL